MLTYTAIGSCVLVLTLATVLVIVLLMIQQRNPSNVGLWLLTGLVGILLGAGGAAAAVQLMGFEIVRAITLADELEASAIADMSMGMGMGGPGGGMGGGMGGGGGGMGGVSMSMGTGGGRGGGGFGPSPKRQLTTLVRKIELLTGDIALHPTPDQTAAIADLLSRIRDRETMTDDEATELYEELLALLDEQQQARQDAIGLPFRRGGGGGGGGDQAEDENPFVQDENADALEALLQRFGGGDAESAPPKAAAPPDGEPAAADPDAETAEPNPPASPPLPAFLPRN